LEFGEFTAAYGDDAGARYAVEESPYMSLSHTAKASDGY
jgi:hypothetical protein